jgi:hypothetical protein
MQPPTNLINAVENYLRLRVAVEVLHPLMEDITKGVMAEFHPQYDPAYAEPRRGGEGLTGEITDPDHLHLMQKDQWDEFYSLLDFAKRDVAGFILPQGYCPELICKSRLVDEEINIAKLVAATNPKLAVFGQKYLDPEIRKELVELTLKWVVPYIDKARVNKLPLPFETEPGTIAARLMA